MKVLSVSAKLFMVGLFFGGGGVLMGVMVPIEWLLWLMSTANITTPY